MLAAENPRKYNKMASVIQYYSSKIKTKRLLHKLIDRDIKMHAFRLEWLHLMLTPSTLTSIYKEQQQLAKHPSYVK